MREWSPHAHEFFFRILNQFQRFFLKKIIIHARHNDSHIFPSSPFFEACYLKTNSVPEFIYRLRNFFETMLTEGKPKYLEKNLSQWHCILYMFHVVCPAIVHKSTQRKICPSGTVYFTCSTQSVLRLYTKVLGEKFVPVALYTLHVPCSLSCDCTQKYLEKNLSQWHCILYMFHVVCPAFVHKSTWRKICPSGTVYFTCSTQSVLRLYTKVLGEKFVPVALYTLYVPRSLSCDCTSKCLEKNLSQWHCILYMFHVDCPVIVHQSSWRKICPSGTVYFTCSMQSVL